MVARQHQFVGSKNGEERERIHLQDPRDDNGWPSHQMVLVFSTIRYANSLLMLTNIRYRLAIFLPKTKGNQNGQWKLIQGPVWWFLFEHGIETSQNKFMQFDR